MKELLIFLLASTGLTMLLVKSNAFLFLRCWISTQLEKKKDKKWCVWFWRWSAGWMNCSMCNAMYSGTFCAIVIYYGYEFYLLPFCAVIVISWSALLYKKIGG